jgi:hypothetical protein
LGPSRDGIQVDVNRIPNDLRIGKLAADLLLGKSQIGFRYEVAPLCGSQRYSIPLGIRIINPPDIPIGVTNRHETQSSGDAKIKEIDCLWKGTSA